MRDPVLYLLQVITIRNDVMHSSNFRITSAELTTKLQTMRDVLQEQPLRGYQSARTAIAAINDVCIIMLLYGQAINTVIGLCEHL